MGGNSLWTCLKRFTTNSFHSQPLVPHRTYRSPTWRSQQLGSYGTCPRTPTARSWPTRSPTIWTEPLNTCSPGSFCPLIGLSGNAIGFTLWSFNLQFVCQLYMNILCILSRINRTVPDSVLRSLHFNTKEYSVYRLGFYFDVLLGNHHRSHCTIDVCMYRSPNAAFRRTFASLTDNTHTSLDVNWVNEFGLWIQRKVPT